MWEWLVRNETPCLCTNLQCTFLAERFCGGRLHKHTVKKKTGHCILTVKVKHATTTMKDLETRGEPRSTAKKDEDFGCRLPCRFVSSLYLLEHFRNGIDHCRAPYSIHGSIARCGESMWSDFRVNEVEHSLKEGVKKTNRLSCEMWGGDVHAIQQNNKILFLACCNSGTRYL